MQLRGTELPHDSDPAPVIADGSVPSAATSYATTSPESAPSSSMFSFTRFKSFISGTPWTQEERTEALLDQMRKSTVFKDCDEVERRDICEIMEPFEFKKGDVMFIQGEPVDKAIFIIKGEVKRLRLEGDQLRSMLPVGNPESAGTVGMLHMIPGDKAINTVKATTSGFAFLLRRPDFMMHMNHSPGLQRGVTSSLCREVVSRSVTAKTPLFQQSGKALPSSTLPWFAIATAAGIESFYRSALNATLNARLSGAKVTSYFPNMHVQTPTRIAYITGFKSIRHWTDTNFKPQEMRNRMQFNVALACLPGVVMTPLSSILEACNVGDQNPEPLARRWTRGILPRGVREVIFGIGINQLSDFCEERFDFVESSNMRNALGSMTAGVASGYLSHIPHNMSTLKLMYPSKSYGEVFSMLSKHYDATARALVPDNLSFARAPMKSALTVLFPRGVLIRTLQICGSFVIINSTINSLKVYKVNVEVTRSGE